MQVNRELLQTFPKSPASIVIYSVLQRWATSPCQLRQPFHKYDFALIYTTLAFGNKLIV